MEKVLLPVTIGDSDTYVLLANIYIYQKDKAKAIQVFKDLIIAVPSLKDQAEQNIAQIQSMR